MSNGTWAEVKRAFVPGLTALKRNLAPVIVLQVAMISLVIAWFRLDSVKHLAQGVSDWKDHASLPLLFLCGTFAGGVLPEVAKLVTGTLKPSRQWMAATLYNAFVYGCVALITNVFYTWLNTTVGSTADLRTVATKTAIDMFVLTPLGFIPFLVTMFEFWALGCSWPKLWQSLKNRFYLRRIVPTLAMAWGYWIPVLCAMYALPLQLQFPMAMLAEGAWSIMVVFVNVHANPASEATA